MSLISYKNPKKIFEQCEYITNSIEVYLKYSYEPSENILKSVNSSSKLYLVGGEFDEAMYEIIAEGVSELIQNDHIKEQYKNTKNLKYAIKYKHLFTEFENKNREFFSNIMIKCVNETCLNNWKYRTVKTISNNDKLKNNIIFNKLFNILTSNNDKSSKDLSSIFIKFVDMDDNIYEINIIDGMFVPSYSDYNLPKINMSLENFKLIDIRIPKASKLSEQFYLLINLLAFAFYYYNSHNTLIFVEEADFIKISYTDERGTQPEYTLNRRSNSIGNLSPNKKNIIQNFINNQIIPKLNNIISKNRLLLLVHPDKIIQYTIENENEELIIIFLNHIIKLVRESNKISYTKEEVTELLNKQLNKIRTGGKKKNSLSALIK
jgi:hypothetical protein